MSEPILLRVDRVERWRPPHADGGPILTTIEVHDVRHSSMRSADRVGPRLSFEHQGDGYTPTRLVLNVDGPVEYEPGDYLALSIEKVARPSHDSDDRDGIPF